MCPALKLPVRLDMETSWIMEDIFPHVALAVWGKSMWSFPGMEDVLWDRSALLKPT